ncbi:MAG TPA: metallophosphoesterase family protein [Methanofastidiosum sp.]|nr:metallophosphoesterase family protein [Methanofastidiosum sp.]
MILFFSDVHLGLRSHSVQNSIGLYSAELDAMKALECIYQRAQKNDIDMILFGGDMTHTNNPLSMDAKFIIYWLHKMDSLGKPFYLITGNHDTSMYSNSIVYIPDLQLRNIKLSMTLDDCPKIKWNDWNIHLVPYIPNKSLKDRDAIVNKALTDCIADSSGKTMILSHVQEFSSKIGSEGRMLSKGVYLLDAETFKDRRIIFLLGHMHMHQIYSRGNVTVVYPGSTTYMDATDLNTKKGYCIIDTDGQISFEEIPGIRRFLKYELHDGVDPVEHFKKARILVNSVAFISYHTNEKINTTSLFKMFRDKDCIVGDIKRRVKEKDVTETLFVNNQKGPYDIFRDALETYKTKVDKAKLLDRGTRKIEQFVEEKKVI